MNPSPKTEVRIEIGFADFFGIYVYNIDNVNIRLITNDQNARKSA
jgi:hypothetical protein